MSSCVEISSTEQLCYIPCSYCNIVLAVSVPCSSLFDIVTVRCGHCSNLWSVNMAAAAFHSLSSSWQHHQPQQQHHHHPQHQQTPTSHSNPIGHNMRMGTENMNMNMMMGSSSNSSSSSTSRYYSTTTNSGVATAATNKVGLRPVPTPAAAANPTADERVVNRPPEKRQRVPSAYNQFIKEEIQRIKANNPDISHREAFSTAAKNWAHFPHIHFGLMLENNNQAKLNEARTTALLNN